MQKNDIKLDNPSVYSKDEFYSGVLNEKRQVDEVLSEYFSTYDRLYLYLYLNEKEDKVIHHGFSIDDNFSYMFDELEYEVRAVSYQTLLEIVSAKMEVKRLAEKIEDLERGRPLSDAELEDFFDDIDEDDYGYKADCEEDTSKTEVISQIRKWLKRTAFIEFCSAVTDRVMGQEETEYIVLNIYNYLQCVAYKKKHNNNMLLAAPSGCGKTETFRAVRDYFKEEIPKLVVYQIDLTSITEEGFTGKNTKDLVYALKNEDKGVGIVFIDEFDKKLIPSYAKGGENVNLAVQDQILTLIEGRMLAEKGKDDVDTSDTLFIGMGSFDYCRKNRKEEAKSIGFKADNEKAMSHYAEITKEDMISLGGSYELIGRFSSVINYHELSSDVVDKLIDRFITQESSNIGCAISISEEMREILHDSANGKYGCRNIRNLIHQSAFRGYLTLCKQGKDIYKSRIFIQSPDDIKITSENNNDEADNSKLDIA